jgi:hypothetical protein
MSMALEYVLKRNIGTVGRPPLACAVCNFTPSGHVLSARLGLELIAVHDKGLCNVHAQGLAADVVISDDNLEQMRQRWLASR